jgi:hypothetical protein
VAQIAGDGGVLIRERKSSGAVIEFSVGPFGDGMAGRASRSGVGETGGDVIRDVAADCSGPIPIGDVAAVAIG